MYVHMRNTAPVMALVGLFTAVTLAQAPPPPAMILAATSANVSGAGEKVEFFVNRWSTDADRDKVAAAWNTKPAPAPAPGAAPAGRGGRGGGRGGGGAPAAPRTPEAALAAALKELPAAGYFFTSEVGGYVVRYAARLTPPNGGSRIVLLTDKRLGSAKDNWRPGAGTPNAYEFSLIEIRMPARGEGEGKVSLTGTITIDPDSKGPVLEGYDTLPVTLRTVQVRSES